MWPNFGKPWPTNLSHLFEEITIWNIQAPIVSLSIHSDKIAIDGQVCFFRQFFSNPAGPGPTQVVWDHWVALIRWHWGASCSKHPLWLVVWSEFTMAVCVAYWVHSLASCVYWGKPTHPPPPPSSHSPTPLYTALVVLQALFKSVSKTSKFN